MGGCLSASRSLQALLDERYTLRSIDHASLAHYLRADVGVMRSTGLGDPRPIGPYRRWSNGHLVMRRVVQAFPADRALSRTAVLIVDRDHPPRTQYETNLNVVLGDVEVLRVRRPIMVCLIWQYYEQNVFVSGHAALLVVHPVLRQIAPWDPNGYFDTGTDPHHLQTCLDLMGAGYTVVPVDHEYGLRPGFLQGLLEPTGPPSSTEPERGLCVFVSSVVLLCALRFDCPHLWLVARLLEDLVAGMEPTHRRRVAQNLVVTLKRVHLARRPDEVHALLGLCRFPAPRALVTRCGVLDVHSGRPCPLPSTAHSPLCARHLAELDTPCRYRSGSGQGRWRHAEPWPLLAPVPAEGALDVDDLVGSGICLHPGKPACLRAPVAGSSYCRRHRSLWNRRQRQRDRGDEDPGDVPPTKRQQMERWVPRGEWMPSSFWHNPFRSDSYGVLHHP